MILTAEFNDEQKRVLKKINVRTDFNSDMSADEVEEYINKVSKHLQLHGLSDDGLNKEGQICEDILNIIADV